jgi:hypothetical protein
MVVICNSLQLSLAFCLKASAQPVDGDTNNVPAKANFYLSSNETTWSSVKITCVASQFC